MGEGGLKLNQESWAVTRHKTYERRKENEIFKNRRFRHVIDTVFGFSIGFLLER
jgi:hypothetical protein